MMDEQQSDLSVLAACACWVGEEPWCQCEAACLCTPLEDYKAIVNFYLTFFELWWGFGEFFCVWGGYFLTCKINIGDRSWPQPQEQKMFWKGYFGRG